MTWLDTLGNIGTPYIIDPFGGDGHGVYVNTMVSSKDADAANARLRGIRDRTNVSIKTGAHVECIIFDTNEKDAMAARGVRFTKDDQHVTAFASKEIILSAGVYDTPKLLELSGVGNPEILRDYGIDALIDLPPVGENLQNSPECRLEFEIDARYTKMRRQKEGRTAASARSSLCSYARLSTPGVNTKEGRARIQNRASVRLMKHKDTQDMANPAFAGIHRHYIQSVLRSQTEGSGICTLCSSRDHNVQDGPRTAKTTKDEEYLSISVSLAHPFSRGSAHISNAADNDLNIDPRSLTNLVDADILARHIQYIEQELVHVMPLSNILKPHRKRDSKVHGADNYKDITCAREYVLKTTAATDCATGTCSMMPREMGGVVDSKLRVYGCRNLRICDASIIPITPGVDLRATVCAIADMAADFIQAG